MVYVDPEIEEQIIKLHMIERRTMRSLAVEFGYSENVVRRIIDNYKKRAEKEEQQAQQLAALEEMRRLKAENEELKKEVDFLKKAAAFFAKESK